MASGRFRPESFPKMSPAPGCINPADSAKLADDDGSANWATGGEIRFCWNAGVRGLAFRTWPEEPLFRRNPINLFLDRGPIEEAAPLEDCLAVRDHVRMAAQIGRGIRGIEFPLVGVFAQDVVGSTDLARPVRVIPRPAHRRNIRKPRQFGSETMQFFFVAELPGTAGAVEQVQLLAAVKAALFPVLRKGAYETHKRSDPGYGGNQQMMLAAAVCIQRELAFGYFPHQQFIARPQLVEAWGERSGGHQLKKKFNFIFEGRGNNGIRTLRPPAVVLDSERGILSRSKVEGSARLDANHPQVGRKLLALADPRPVKFLIPNRHRQIPETRARLAWPIWSQLRRSLKF